MRDRITDTESEAGEDRRPWMNPGVGGIGSASFLADVGHEIPTSLMAGLVTSTLGAPAAALGLIEGISEGLAGGGRFVGGALADDPQRRRTVAVGGYTATAVLSALIGASTSVVQAGVLRGAAWAARGLRVPARNALLADVVPAHAYGRAYGFERTMDNLGAIVGPLLALGLVSLFSIRTAILISVVPGVLAALAIGYAIRQAELPKVTERRRLRFRIRPVFQGQLGRVMTGFTAFEVGNGLRPVRDLLPGDPAARRRLRPGRCGHRLRGDRRERRRRSLRPRPHPWLRVRPARHRASHRQRRSQHGRRAPLHGGLTHGRLRLSGGVDAHRTGDAGLGNHVKDYAADDLTVFRGARSDRGSPERQAGTR
jgi:hypothetical protein